MTIWEEYNISLDDYAKAFNKKAKAINDGISEIFSFIIDKPRISGIVNMGNGDGN